MSKKILKKIPDFLYSFPRILFINFYKLFTRIKIFNKKRLAGRNSAIFAINHTADADPIVLLAAIKKKICFLAESENFGNWLSNLFMSKFANCVPVFKNRFSKNVKSFKKLFNASREENVFFGIFPEGVLSNKDRFKEFKKGAAYLSYKTGLPIIPVYMHNMIKAPESKRWIWTNRITRGIISLTMNTFKRINIFIGKPIDPAGWSMPGRHKDCMQPGAYREIIYNINKALEEEFLKLADEADELFGAGGGEAPVVDALITEK